VARHQPDAPRPCTSGLCRPSDTISLHGYFFERDVESGSAGDGDFEVVGEHRDLVDQLVNKGSSLVGGCRGPHLFEVEVGEKGGDSSNLAPTSVG
jgi:hypothetical protein